MSSPSDPHEAGENRDSDRSHGGRGVVLDSSALLCVLNGETGARRVAAVLPAAVIGAVNLAEVVTKLREKGLSADETNEVLNGLNLDVRSLTAAQAIAVGHLRPATRALGLSLGDRACLALAIELDRTAVTADKVWAGAEDATDAVVEVVR